MDLSGDGFVTKEELKEALIKSGDFVDEQEVDGMIETADLNADGKVDFNEFLK